MKKVLLSKMILPESNYKDINQLYFKGYGFQIQGETKKICFSKNAELLTSTYFNSFSINKWKKYTKIQNITLNITFKGSLILNISTMSEKNGEVCKTILESITIKSDTVASKSFLLDFNSIEDILYFDIQCEQDNSELADFSYTTEIDESLLNYVKLAVGICTFKREEFVTKNLNKLNEELSSENSLLKDKFDVFVSDNGQSLDLNKYNTTHIKTVYNKNLGGAGGFTRCLIEALNANNGYTNFIFLDDDIILNINALIKNYIFLTLIKDEFKSATIGGAMFSTDNMWLQFENASCWEGTRFIFNQRDVDLRKEINVIRNEKEFKVNYNAWCYCCIPFDVVTKSNLPIPIFFHMDDIEYNLRNKFKIITLNGINVWHLYKKTLKNPKNDYYDVRNKLIMLSEIDKKNVLMMAKKYITSFSQEALRYNYASCINALNGILDFSKGFEYFKELDTQKKHKKLFNNTKWVPMTEVLPNTVVTEGNLRGKKNCLKIAFKEFFKLKKRELFVLDSVGNLDAIKAKHITLVNQKEKQCITYKKKIFLMIKCFFLLVRSVIALKKKIPKAVEEFSSRLSELQNIDFWNKYLGIEKDKKTKKIIFVASDNDFYSGAFRSMAALSKLIQDKTDYDISIILPQEGDGVKLLRQSGVRYTIINSVDWIIKEGAGKKDIKRKKEQMKINREALKKFKKYFSVEKPDLIHINTSYHYVAAIAANKLNIPVVWHLREFLQEDQARKFVNQQYAVNLISKSKSIIPISKSLYEKYFKLIKNKEKLIQIYNGIDHTLFLKEEHTIFQDEKIVFLQVGNIDNYKGQHLIIKALGEYKKLTGFNEFVLKFIGTIHKGSYQDLLESLVKEYNLEENVSFLGRKEDTHNYYKDADVVFVGSKAEAFGRITVEAMLSGCLVLGANTCGTKELIDDEETGLLFDYENDNTIVDRIKFIFENKEAVQKIASDGRQKALNYFTAEINANNVLNVYKKVLGE